MSSLLIVKDIVNENATTLRPDMPLASAIDILLNSKSYGAPVCDSTGILVGFLSAHDVMVEMWCQDYQPDTDIKVQDLMKTDLVTLDINASLTDVLESVALDKEQLYPVTSMGYATQLSSLSVEQRAKEMKVNKPQILPVLNQGKLSGVVSRQEILMSLRTLFPEVPLPKKDDAEEQVVSKAHPNAVV
ncbi:CBS domain-containing protein [Vibrio sp. HN007]|uniref:CBS domain-containing protein n=1 Tax=Vibrio iocasae TaxID=3098914 RepID=UPI0035D51F8C